jgi:hypothetical protein
MYSSLVGSVLDPYSFYDLVTRLALSCSLDIAHLFKCLTFELGDAHLLVLPFF